MIANNSIPSRKIRGGSNQLPSGEISIHFQFISSGINRISADIISISAYRKAFYAYIMAAGLHKKCKKHIPPIKEKGNKKERSPLMGAPSVHIMPAIQITRGLACHFSRFTPLIDNLSIQALIFIFCALCAAFCGLWSMPHAIGV